MTSLVKITDFLGDGIAKNVFPGAHLVIAQNNQMIMDETVGSASLIPEVIPLTSKTLFDIASLTKPMCTASIFMRAVDQKKISVDDSINLFFKSAPQEITIKQLLNHTSGLIDYKPFYKKYSPTHTSLRGGKADEAIHIKNQLLQEIENELTHIKKSGKTLYSDLGYILLGVILENLYKKSLDQIFLEEVAKPLGLQHTFFIGFIPPPLRGGGQGEGEYAATEDCPWRKRVLCGEVHDEHAFLMGGVAGHAGLFSNPYDILKWINEIDNALKGESKWLSQQTAQLFTSTEKKQNRTERFFTLGFDTPSDPSSSGQYFADNSLGHLGYTGTSFWWDRKKELVMILLTNRVHPTRTNEAIKIFRPELHDLISESLK